MAKIEARDRLDDYYSGSYYGTPASQLVRLPPIPPSSSRLFSPLSLKFQTLNWNNVFKICLYLLRYPLVPVEIVADSLSSHLRP